MSDKPEKKISILASFGEEADKKSSILQELYLEFFGVFIPGFLLISGFSILLFLWLSFFVDPISILAYVTQSGTSSYVLLLSLIVSYAAGAILNRKSPDVPDEISAFRTWQEKKKKDKKRTKEKDKLYDGVNDFDASLDNDSCWHKVMMCLCPGWWIGHLRDSELGEKFERLIFIKYPYAHLRRYLIKRGLNHLLIFVPWCECVGGSNIFRSRAIINELKNIINFYGPKVFLSDLIHAEGNIRMFTSLWHVCRYLLILSVCSLLLLASVFFIQFKNYSSCVANAGYSQCEYHNILDGKSIRNKTTLYFCNTISKNDKTISKLYFQIPVLVGPIVLVFSAKKGIEKSIHYLRLKEIVMVLQQAYLLRAKFPEERIWSVMRARDARFKKLAKKRRRAPCKNSLFFANVSNNKRRIL